MKKFPLLNSKFWISDFGCRGQVMLLTVLSLGGTILGATTVAGLLMLYQLRQANDTASSARAIFAADAGIEWGLYKQFQAPGDIPLPEFENGATVLVRCGNNEGNEVDCESASTTNIRSVGYSRGSSRAFQLSF